MTLSEEFLAKGIVKIVMENAELLNRIRDKMAGICCARFGSIKFPEILDHVHKNISIDKLNDFRMCAIKALNSYSWIEDAYFSLAKNALHELVGNELVMQRNINLSIQLPGDDSSLLPIHADVLQGDSPYEVVLWVPLVDCYNTKSMFFARNQPATLAGKSLNDLYAECDPYFVDCEYGEALIFSQNWFHGNRVNETNETRWSLNCRFKSLFSPYADKKLGEFFEPIEIRPVTKMGMRYELPSI